MATQPATPTQPATMPDVNADTNPLLSRVLSHTNMGTTKKHRRRRSASRPSQPVRRQSFSRDIGHAAAETYLVTRLSFKLLRYLGYYFFIIMLCFVSQKIVSVRVFFHEEQMLLFRGLMCGSYIIYDQLIRGNLSGLFYQFFIFQGDINFPLNIFQST